MALGTTISVLMFPVIPWAGGASCGSLALQVRIGVSLVIVLWVLAAVVWGGLIKLASSYLLATAFMVGLYATWWLAIGVWVLSCKTPAAPQAPVLLGGALLIGIAAMFKPVVSRIDKVVAINRASFDFEHLKYRLGVPLRRLDGSDNSHVGPLMVSVGIASVAVAGAALKAVPKNSGDQLFVAVCFFIGLLLIGGVVVGQLRLAYLARRQSAQAGQPVLLAE